MKKWSLIVAGLYGSILLLLFVPLGLLAFIPDSFAFEVSDGYWEDWVFILTLVAVLILAQYSLLRVPVRVASRRPVTRRSLWATIMAAAFMMGLLVFGAAACIDEFVKRDIDDLNISLFLGAASWALWALYFYRSTRSSSSDQVVSHVRRFLWAGSILELLIAIPTHIVARHRGYCCAGVMTFIGLTCGLSVMLFAFGPAVYFLFAERWKRLHPAQQVA